jgi:hypothetical protein
MKIKFETRLDGICEKESRTIPKRNRYSDALYFDDGSIIDIKPGTIVIGGEIIKVKTLEVK